METGRKKHLPVPHEAKSSFPNLGFNEDWEKDAFRTSSIGGAKGPKRDRGGNLTDASPLDRLRFVIQQRGENNMFHGGYGRKFRLADRNNNHLLSRDEFSVMLQRQGFKCTQQEEEQLWHQFDRDNSGRIDFNEFLRTLRGGMNAFRRQLVDVVFAKFDVDSSGTVDVYDIRASFNPYGAGKSEFGPRKSEYETYREFLISFGDKHPDGRVTREEFHAYYEGVSSYIDSDSYFELMIRNAWHLDGGAGQSANTANLRVCVTFDDGTEEVLTLDDDFGTNLRSQGASQRVIDRLEQQGYHGIVGVEWLAR